jgi:hypothetical protein
MDSKHFDGLIQLFASKQTRRATVLAFVGTALLDRNRESIEAKKRKRKRKRNGRDAGQSDPVQSDPVLSNPGQSSSALSNLCPEDRIFVDEDSESPEEGLFCCPQHLVCGDICCFSEQVCLRGTCCPADRICGSTCCGGCGSTCVDGVCVIGSCGVAVGSTRNPRYRVK